MSDVPHVKIDHPSAQPQASAPAAPSPSAAIAEGQKAQTFEHDGRRYVMRWLSTLDRMKVFRALGAELSSNQAYLSYALVIASISSIDGEMEPLPTSAREFEAMAKRVGDDVFEILEQKTIDMAQGRADSKAKIDTAKN